MTQTHTERRSDSPYIDRVWKSINTTDGIYLATPDGSWDLIFGLQPDGLRTAWLAGQASKSSHVPYTRGSSSIVISFSTGVYMPDLNGDIMIDMLQELPMSKLGYFELGCQQFVIPTFETAEDLVTELAEKKIIVIDEIVANVMMGTPMAMSDRSMQRHFHKVTGMSKKGLEQIWRAQEAIKQLQAGVAPKDVAANAGYSDQPHLAKSLKKIMHSLPSDVDDIHKL